MSRFAAVPKSTVAQTPDYASAVVQQKQLNDAEYARKYQRNMELARDGVSGANKLMEWDKARKAAEIAALRSKAPISTGLGPMMGSQIPSVAPQMTAESIAANATPDMVGQLATNAPVEEMSNYVMAPATDAAMDSATGAAGSSVPIISALRGGQQLANGDVEGVLGTGAKAGLAMLGPYGTAAGLGLGLLGV